MVRAVAAVCLALGVSIVHAQAPPAYTLARIEANGLHRFSVADLTRVSGLKVGQSVGPAELDAAAKQMVSTGIVKNVRYRVTTDAGQLSLTFDIEEETDWSVPVVFDNFIWIADDELTAAVREAVPAFDGTAPLSGPVTSTIVRALTGALRRHNITGDVDYRAGGTLAGTERRHLFSVMKPAPPTCALRFEGATKIKESELLKIVPDIVGRPYSRRYFEEYSEKSLAPTYQRRGFWRATLSAPAVKPGDAAGCTGALVTIHVDEGDQFRMGTVSVQGVPAKDANAIKKNWKLKSGAVFDAVYLTTFQRDLVRATTPPGRLAAQAVQRSGTLLVDVVVAVKQ